MKKLIFVSSVLALVLLYSSEKKTKPQIEEIQKQPPSHLAEPYKTVEKSTEFSVRDPSQLTMHDLKKAIWQLDQKLKKFETLSYDQFSSEQMSHFESLNRQKAVLMKAYIFKKFGSYI